MMRLKNVALSAFLFICLFLFAVAQASQAQEIDCEKIPLSDPKTLEKQFLKLYCHAQNEQHSEVKKLLDQIKGKLAHIEDYLLHYEANAMLGLGQTEEAEALFLKVLKDHPNSAIIQDSREQLAEIYIETKRHEAAEDMYFLLARSTESRWKKAIYLKNVGEIKEKQGTFYLAAKIFERIWVEHPEVSFSDYVFELYRKNKKVFNPSPRQFAKRGEIMFKAGNWKEALEALSRSPRTKTVKTKIGICLYRLSRFEDALKAFSGIDSPKAFYWKGLTLSRMERENEAIETFKLLYRLNPKSRWTAKSLVTAARLLSLREEFKEAQSLYNLIIDKYPGRKEASKSAWNLGWIHYKKKEYQKALDIFSSRAWSAGSERERFIYWYARTTERMGDKPSTLFALGKLADSPHISYYSSLARLKLKRPFLPPQSPTAAYSGNPFGENPALKKFLFFSKAGTYDLALREAGLLRPQAKTVGQKLHLASLYLEARNYKGSINTAAGLRSPEALRLSFPKGFEEHVRFFSRKHSLDEFLVYSVIREESHFDTEAVSVSDARGLMQLLPTTALEAATKLELGNFKTSQLFSPEVNINLGCYYLSWLLKIFEGNLILSVAGYNGGPTNAKIWNEKNGALDIDEFIEEIPFKQSRDYVKKILRSYAAYEAFYGKEKNQSPRQSLEKFLKITSP